jgi:hypothetical protein
MAKSRLSKMPQDPVSSLAVEQSKERVTGFYLNFQHLWHSVSNFFASSGM